MAFGLGAETLADLLDSRLSVCAFLLAQLADEGKADPSPLSLRLIGSSLLAWRAIECDATDVA